MKKLYILLLILIVFSIVFRILQNNESSLWERKTFRVYQTWFESIEDFTWFFITPQYGTSTYHELSKEYAFSWMYSHKAIINHTNPKSAVWQNNNHRAYPTLQFQKTQSWSLACPCMIYLQVWVDWELKAQKPENEWLSFATFTSDVSDSWKRTVLVNLSYDGIVHLMHVPEQWESQRIFQNTNKKFPFQQWVGLKIYLDLDPNTWYAKVWQDWELVSYAQIKWMNGLLSQAHFWLYASPSVSKLTVLNDNLRIEEVSGE